MTGMVFEFALNILVALLLVVTIAYCWVLNRRIRILQDSKSELARLIAHFDQSTEKASSSIVNLQQTGKKIGELVQQRIDRANFLADDLAFLIEKANRLADQLQGQLSSGIRRAGYTGRAEAPAAPPPFAPSSAVTTREQAQYQPQARNPAISVPALERLEKKPVSAVRKPRNEPQAEEAPRQPNVSPAQAKLRSRVERELLDLIKAGH